MKAIKMLVGVLAMTTTSRSNAYSAYKAYCQEKKAVLTAHPGKVGALERHRHIVLQREILRQMLT